MRLDRRTCEERMTAARVAYLATVNRAGSPHLVPITFVVDAGRVLTAVDQKPKSTMDLRRLRNIAREPRVAVLCDHYDDDWSRLWWVRANGHAMVVQGGETRDHAIARLTAKYHQYRTDPPRGPAVVITVTSWSGWSAGS